MEHFLILRVARLNFELALRELVVLFGENFSTVERNKIFKDFFFGGFKLEK
jgi:hypothetical protein